MSEQFPENISLKIHYGPHASSADFNFLDDALQDSDTHIYIPEVNGYTPRDIAGYNKIANGDSKVYQEALRRMNPDGIFQAQFKALFASRKRVEFVDMAAEEIYTDPYQLALLALQQRHSRSGARSYQEVSERFLESLTLEARLSMRRDEVIAHNIIHELPEKIRTNQRLDRLGAVGVFMTLGDMHDEVTSRLEAAGVPVLVNEVTAEKMAGEKAGIAIARGESITQSQIDESLAAGRLVQHLHDATSTNELRRVVNELTDGFEQSDTEEVLRVYGLGSVAVHQYVRSQIDSRGISVSEGFQYVTPQDKTPYTPVHVPISIKGRSAVVAGLL